MAADPFPPPGEGIWPWLVGMLLAAVGGLFGLLMKSKDNQLRDARDHSKELMESHRIIDKAITAIRQTYERRMTGRDDS